MRQAEAFVKLADRRREEEHTGILMATRVAYHADEKNFTKYLKDLDP